MTQSTDSPSESSSTSTPIEPGKFIRIKDSWDVWVTRVLDDGEIVEVRYKQQRGYRYTVRKAETKEFLKRHRRA